MTGKSARLSVHPDGHVWRGPDGAPVSCREKIKVLDENLLEIKQMAQDALEDAVLMGCDEKQFRQVMHTLLDSLETPFQPRRSS